MPWWRHINESFAYFFFEKWAWENILTWIQFGQWITLSILVIQNLSLHVTFEMTSPNITWHQMTFKNIIRHHVTSLCIMSSYWSVKLHLTWYEPIKTLKSKMENVATSTLLSMGVQHLSACNPMGMEIEPVNFEDLGLVWKWLLWSIKINQSNSWFPHSILCKLC